MWKNILLVLLSIILALLMAEGLVRMFVDEEYDYPRGLYVADNTRGYWLSPGFCGSHRQINGDFSVRYCINKFGYRNTGVAYPVSESEVLILGDSFSFGVGVNDEETFSSMLSDISGLRVTNGAISGYDVPSAIKALDIALAEGAHPKVVVLGIYLGNDLLPADVRPIAEEVAVIQGVQVSRSAINSHNKLKIERRLRHYVRLYGFLASRLTQWISASTLYQVAHYRLSVLGLLPEEHSSIFRRLENDITQLQRHYMKVVPTGRLIILSVPTKFQVEAKFQDELCKELDICPETETRLESINRLNEVGKQLDIPVVNMYPVLMHEALGQTDEYYYYHNTHWNARAHKLVSNALWQKIQMVLDHMPSR